MRRTVDFAGEHKSSAHQGARSGLEGGDERVRGLQHKVVHITFVLEPDGESHRHYS